MGYSRIIICLLFSLSFIAHGDSGVLVKDSEIKDYLDSFYREVLSNWTVSTRDDDQAGIYLSSKLVNFNPATNYCIQNVIRLEKNSTGSLVDVAEQVRRIRYFSKYSLNQEKVSCEQVNEESLFYVGMLDNREPSIEFLTTLSKITEKPWLEPSIENYNLTYINDEAKACLTHKGSLNVIDVKETGFSDGSFGYEVLFTGCVLSNKEYIINSKLSISLDKKDIGISSSALDKETAECLRVECYRVD